MAAVRMGFVMMGNKTVKYPPSKSLQIETIFPSKIMPGRIFRLERDV
jgi:hypothetical protein